MENDCSHPKTITHALVTGDLWTRCQHCGATDKNDGKGFMAYAKPAKKVPDSYQQRKLKKSSKGAVYTAVPEYEGGGWVTFYFGKAIQPATYDEAQDMIDSWNESCHDSGMLLEYRLNTNLQCIACGEKCNETYKGDICLECHMKEKMALTELVKKNKPKMPLTFTPQYTPVKPPIMVKNHSLVLSIVRKAGDIWKLDKSNSPFGSTQWGYQGSAKTPYVITEYPTKRDGSVTADGWACSCPSFTQHTPRTPCKHILNVMRTMRRHSIKEGANKLNLFADKGRKFR